MAHNIAPAREYQPGINHDDPVLTVNDGVGAVSLHFHTPLGSVLPPRVVVNPWSNGEAVSIEGEDLYALRELLNELPESAFVRPADPVDPDLKALQDAPVKAIAVSGNGWAFRKIWERGIWVTMDEPHVQYSTSDLPRGAKIVWTPTP